MYYKGDTVTFQDSEAEHVAELLAIGSLAGPVADEHEMQRIYNEMSTKMRGMSVPEQQKLWRSYLKMDEDARLEAEAAEARRKDTKQEARLANIADPTRTADDLPKQPETEPVITETDSKANDEEVAAALIIAAKRAKPA